jgi:hypothetical protein
MSTIRCSRRVSSSADAVVLPGEVEGCSDEGGAGECGDLGLVAGVQHGQVGVGSVGDADPFCDKLSAVVRQDPQFLGDVVAAPRGLECRLVAQRDPRDRESVDRVALPAVRARLPLADGEHARDLTDVVAGVHQARAGGAAEVS